MRSIAAMIQEMWKEGKCPLIDGVLFDDGRLFACKYKRVEIRGMSGFSAEIPDKKPSAIESAIDMNVDFSEIDPSFVAIDAGNGIKYSCGEGGFGGDGFVSCSSLPDDHLYWIAFFQRSNPFDDITINKHEIIARNNLGHLWRFSIEDPTDIHVA